MRSWCAWRTAPCNRNLATTRSAPDERLDLYTRQAYRRCPSRACCDRYPVRRIFCVGRNYAAHAAEMGVAVDREAPFYFTKSPHAACASGSTTWPYPPGTENFHYEMELVVALGADASHRVEPRAGAGDAVYAYGCGLDMTRRDLQLAARENSGPGIWARTFEESAVLARTHPGGPLRRGRSAAYPLRVNDELPTGRAPSPTSSGA
jgi:fumarylpyruvate hydrolase